MPSTSPFVKVIVAELDQPRDAIVAYVHRHRLSFVDDASNDDPRFARNRLRLGVWPALVEAFADAESSLAAAARRAQEAAACLSELAAMDLATASSGEALRLEPALALGEARRKNLLRAWLARVTGAPAPDTLLQRLAQELPGARGGRWPAPGGELRLHGGDLHFASALPSTRGVAGEVGPLDLRRAGRVHLPGWGGDLVVEPVAHGGVAAAELAAVELRPREGGERFQIAPGAPARSLKKQYQTRRVPAWQREGPLLFSNGQLLFVPSLGIDARRWCHGGAPQMRLDWLPSALAGSRQPGG